MIYQLIDEEKTRHPVSRMAQLLGASRQGYYKHRDRTRSGPTAKERSDADLSERIQAHHKRSRGTYGAPRIQAGLAEHDGMRAGRNRITRLMRRQGLVGVHRRTGRKSLTQRDAMASAPPDLVGRHVTEARTGKTSWTCAYAVTSLEAGQAEAARLGALMRGHCNIEAWHHIKDTSVGEDACKVRSGHAPDNQAALRAMAIVLWSGLGQDTVPDAIRWVSYEAFTRPLDLLGLP